MGFLAIEFLGDDMYRYELSIGWQTPNLPRKEDAGDYRGFVRRNFMRWLISANIDKGDDRTLLAVGLLGFYVTLYVPMFWKRGEVA